MDSDVGISPVELVKLFRTQAAEGWNITEACFDEPIPEPFWPEREQIFKAFAVLAPQDVQYLIIGKDPYASVDGTGRHYATGVAFAIPEYTNPVPNSLARILRHIDPDGLGKPTEVFSDWISRNRVLMLNAALTVPRLLSGSDQSARTVSGKHLPLWRQFSIEIVKQLILQNRKVKLIAWGADAKDVLCEGMEAAGLFTYAYHPSTNSTEPRDFDRFWKTDVGRSLIEHTSDQGIN